MIEPFKIEFKALRVSLIIICVFLSMLAYGCTHSSLKNYIRPQIDFTKFRKIAVFPLENMTANEFSDEKIENLLIIDLLSRGVEVIEPGEVSSALTKSKVRSVQAIPAADVQKIGKSIQADAVIIGSGGTFAMSKGISVSYPEVSIHLMLIDISSGDIVWSVWHTSGGPSFWTRHFGAEGATLDEVSKEVVRDAVDTLF